MAISERDIKLLWGRAAGRCSVCKISVTADKQSVAGAYPFGENAHIVAEKPDGPRGDAALSEILRNSYLNLILLCPTCHTKIDKAPEDFSIESLHQFKRDHESEMASMAPPDKASYDESLMFSRVTEANWLSPDRENYVPIGVTKEEWVAPFLEPNLRQNLPKNLIQLFEVARSCMIYSWFFYPLATLGFEQLARVGELAVRERCRLQKQERADFAASLQWLVAAKTISPEEERRWQAIASLSNGRSHPTGLMLIDPGQAVGFLRTITDLINELFRGV